jgi:Flp pilus assembly protein TadG
MKTKRLSFVRRALSEQQGQTLIIVALSMFAMLGVGGLVIDLGRFYLVRSQLQNSVNAAGLAAAGDIYNTGSLTAATTEAQTFENKYSTVNGLPVTYPTPTTPCLNMLMIAPATCANSGNVPNAIRVTAQVSMPTWFMRLFGVKTLVAQATATASMQGVAQRWNVAVIIDSTDSMGTSDSNCGNLTEYQCALGGVQALLTHTQPCATAAGSSCTPSIANFRVSLFTFPNLATSTGTITKTKTTTSTLFSNTNPCASGTTFTPEPYTLPLTAAGTSYPPVTGWTGIEYSSAWTGSSPATPTGSGTTNYWTATYQVVNWDSGFYSPGDTNHSGLTPPASDNLVAAIGYGTNDSTGAAGTKGCLTNWGGESTYYASVIYAAQQALVMEQANFPGSQNALIILSDGQANAASGKFPSGQSPSVTTLAADGISTLTGTGLYPDSKDECQQAIIAAQAAQKAGTRVYAVAYGAESTGCGVGGVDTTLLPSSAYPLPLNQSFSSLSSLIPCVVMENIASPTFFYSDSQQSGSAVDKACVDNSHTASSLQSIFSAISATFTQPRLLPNNAT